MKIILRLYSESATVVFLYNLKFVLPLYRSYVGNSQNLKTFALKTMFFFLIKTCHLQMRTYENNLCANDSLFEISFFIEHAQNDTKFVARATQRGFLFILLYYYFLLLFLYKI